MEIIKAYIKDGRVSGFFTGLPCEEKDYDSIAEAKGNIIPKNRLYEVFTEDGITKIRLKPEYKGDYPDIEN